MDNKTEKILVWLPSPMGDAVLCTPALRAIRHRFDSAQITFLANAVVRQVLSPGTFNDNWLDQPSAGPLSLARMLRRHKFTLAVLFKNSFASALATCLAPIPQRVGYSREVRGIFLTGRLYPPRLADGSFKPLPMIDYYLAVASWLGAETENTTLQLAVDPTDRETLLRKLPELKNVTGPLVILVPGGAFGPSKCWPADRFAATADRLIQERRATVVVSVAANAAERQIAAGICAAAKNPLISLADTPITLGQLKALYEKAGLVISNDTGPRHIAIALGCKVITLFGPNDPAWTDTDSQNEIQIVGTAPCAPCQKPKCKTDRHLCMESITVETVLDAAAKLIERP